MISKKIFLFLFVCSVAYSCKRGEGQGGSSKITGKIYERKYNANFSAIVDSGYTKKEDVYIIYGDDVTFGDDQKTNYDGTYEFNYLRKGKYKVYAYSKDSTKYPYTSFVAVVQEVEITKNKQTVTVPDIILVK